MLLYYNGVVHTLDEHDTQHEAIALRDGKIVEVGSAADLRQKYSAFNSIDLEGAQVFPGFVDAHAHPLGMGERITKPRLELTGSREDVYATLRPLTGGNGWIISRGWDQNRWGETSFPTRFDLDRNISTSQPIALTRIDGHALWCNSRALEIAGVDRTTSDPLGGAILHDAHGELTGILLDEAMKLVEKVIPAPSPGDLPRTLRAGLQHFVLQGHAGVHEMGVSEEVWNVYRSLYESENDSLPRASVFLDMTKPSGRGLFYHWYKTGVPSTPDRLHFAGIKLYLDGALGSRGAYLFEDYDDDPGNTGLALMDDKEATEMMSMAAAMDLQVAVHAIGDKANARALDLFEPIRKQYPSAVLRIEHAQIVQEEDLARFERLRVNALVQPAFYSSDREWALLRLGSSRMRTAYRWRSFLEHGVPLIASSDAPIEQPNVLDGIRLLTTRDGVNDGEAIPWSDAIRAYAQTAHELDGSRSMRGELRIGMNGDLTVVSADMSSIADVLIDGKSVR